MMNIACDDGSTNVKLAWIENGEIKTHVSQNAFREGWATPLAFGGKTIYNYLIDGRKFTHDIGSTSAITTTHTSFQFDAVSRVAIHHALLTSGLEPQDVELTVTLPVAMFFTSDAQLNEANIEKKKANVMGPITLNNGETFHVVKVNVMPESVPAAEYLIDPKTTTQLTRTLVVDLGGTTLDLAIIQGAMEGISDIFGNSDVGVSRVTKAVMAALQDAQSPSSYAIADIIIKNRHDRALIASAVNDHSKIDAIIEIIYSESKNLAEAVAADIRRQNSVHKIILAGGGAELIHSHIVELFPKLDVIKAPDAQLALVKAMASV